MSGRLPDKKQCEPFRPTPADMTDRRREPALLAGKINRQYFEDEFSQLYSGVGTSSVPLRLTAGCLLLKHTENSDDVILPGRRVREPYLQYFCGMRCFEHTFPLDPGDSVHFRRRTGEAGVASFSRTAFGFTSRSRR